MRKYPNLPLLDYKFKKAVTERYAYTMEDLEGAELTARVFPQLWPSAAGGRSAPGSFSGAAMTIEYTTVMVINPGEDRDNIGCVFFGEDMGYMVYSPLDNFFSDMVESNMKSTGESWQYDERKVEEHNAYRQYRDKYVIWCGYYDYIDDINWDGFVKTSVYFDGADLSGFGSIVDCDKFDTAEEAESYFEAHEDELFSEIRNYDYEVNTVAHFEKINERKNALLN